MTRRRNEAPPGEPTVPGRTGERRAVNTRAVVVHPAVRGHATSRNSAENRLVEAQGLAAAVGLNVEHAEVARVDEPKADTLLGGGTVERLARVAAANDAGVVLVDGELSPVQQRNLENTWNAKVVDRTGIILEIFGARARTKEGSLQVELAALMHQRSRLVRSWTHLERQRGGYGFMGGPGERQIELDRRIIDDRIARLRRDLQEMRKTRDLQREQRREAPYPVVALVGYTNAGKSTLFNQLTGGEAAEHDMVFATLDPTMRTAHLPGGRRAIVTDTVGFISDLPTQLVAAFRATLEEVLEAGVIVHVRDMAHPEREAQKTDVEGVLADLGVDQRARATIVEAWNKLDLLPGEQRAALQADSAATPRTVPCSAATGEGRDAVLGAIQDAVDAEACRVAARVPLSDGAALAWLYERGHVLDRRDDEAHAHVRVRLDAADLDRFRKRHGVHVDTPA